MRIRWSPVRFQVNGFLSSPDGQGLFVLASCALPILGRATGHPSCCSLFMNSAAVSFSMCTPCVLELSGWLLFITTFTFTFHFHFIYMHIWLLRRCASRSLFVESLQDDWRRLRLLCVNRKKSISHVWHCPFHLAPLISSKSSWLAACD